MPNSLPSQDIRQRDSAIRIGVDMGGSDLKFGATNLAGDQVLVDELVKRSSLTQGGPQKTIAQTLDGIAEVMQKTNTQWANIADIAVTVPCPCSADGVIIEATNIGTAETKELWKVPFGEHLAEAVKQASGESIPVFCCNDANAAGQDDDFARFGLSSDNRSSVFITTGTGLGGCVMADGHVVFGLGQAGELGHVKPTIPVRYAARFADDPHPRCGCGAVDCVEARASLKGLVRRIEWALSEAGADVIRQQLAADGRTLNDETLTRLRELATRGPEQAAYNVRTFADRDEDAFCRWLLEDWAIMIGALFASLAPVLHPNLFIIGGGMTEMSPAARDWFIEVVRRVYGEVNSQSCFASRTGNCEIVWSKSQDQGWRGAILMAIRSGR
ncbi:MAG: ROK family protein [Planctomycetales bacterium]|nr:ROK family protein [Planctomycetales bacterium]